jgi:hypothetical protein
VSDFEPSEYSPKTRSVPAPDEEVPRHNLSNVFESGSELFPPDRSAFEGALRYVDLRTVGVITQ